jgi:hypothetical protein
VAVVVTVGIDFMDVEVELCGVWRLDGARGVTG